MSAQGISPAAAILEKLAARHSVAERVVIDLKDKVGGLVIPAPGGDGPAPAGDDHTAARDALVGLGMSVSEAEAALRPIDEALPVEERVRLALSGAVPA